MALANPFDKPATTTAAPRGGGGGNKPNRPKRPKNRNNGGGGGGNADASGAVTTTNPGITGLTAAPDAWMRGQLSAAGYTPDGGRPFDTFVQNTIVDPFVSGWDTYQTNPANTNKTILDYANTQGYGGPALTAANANLDPVAFNQYIQNRLNQFSMQQQGIYDAGKDKGGVRWNIFG